MTQLRYFSFLLVMLPSLFAQDKIEIPSLESEGHLIIRKPYVVRITKNIETLGNRFNFEDFSNGIDVTLQKRKFRLWTQYDLYKNDGNWDATAKYSWSSYFNPLAYISNSLGKINVVGSDGNFLGQISGTLFTLDEAKFYIYDRNYKFIAVANLKEGKNELQINAANAPKTKGLATLYRENTRGSWILSVTKPKDIDHRLLKFVSAYLIDLVAD